MPWLSGNVIRYNSSHDLSLFVVTSPNTLAWVIRYNSPSNPCGLIKCLGQSEASQWDGLNGHRLSNFDSKFGWTCQKLFNFVPKLKGPKSSSIPCGLGMGSGWAGPAQF